MNPAPATARAMPAAAQQGGYGKREIIIRANGLDTPWGRDDIAADLAAAQQDKLASIAARIAGARSVLEIGCGWGALAESLARRHEARVTRFDVFFGHDARPPVRVNPRDDAPHDADRRVVIVTGTGPKGFRRQHS